MKKINIRSVLLFGFIFLITPIVVLGQNTEALCRAFANQAFRDLGNNCANLSAGEACYAYGNFGEVTATFYSDGVSQVVRESMFNEPSERVSLINPGELETLETLNAEEFFLDIDNDRDDENRWGVALLEVSANLPRQLEQNTAVYILFGGARLENGVLPQDALVLSEVVSVDVNDGSSIYGSPEGLGYSVPDVVVGTANGALEADGISPDGNWVRVFYRYDRDFGERATAWVKVEDLAETERLDTLPVIRSDTFTTMQKFFLINNFTTPVCEDIPAPGLLVQGPGELETDFMINNMPVRVTSTAYFRQIAPTRLQVTALSGFTVLFPDTVDEEVIPEGFARTVCLSEELDLGIDGQITDREVDSNCPESDLTPNLGLGGFERLPNNLLNYGISLPREVCPSGVGNVECQIVPNPNARIPERCAAGQLPQAVCQRFGS